LITSKDWPREVALVAFLGGGARLDSQDRESPKPIADETVMVVVRDGTELATNVFFPPGDGEGPWPVILKRSPYGKDNLNGSSREMASKGYVVVCQDTRGRFNSSGSDAFVFRSDQDDGHDTMAWIVKQPWCDGNIRTSGSSALGFTQMAAAPGAPPELKAMYVGVTWSNMYTQFVQQGGTFRKTANQWLDGLKDQGARREWTAHSTYDEFWQRRSLDRFILNVPPAVMTVGGWFDAEDLVGPFKVFHAVEKNDPDVSNHLVIGPWSHGAWAGRGVDEYVSDPNRPVPFIDSISLGMPQRYMVGDQRFASKRTDVLVYQTEVLAEDISVVGPVAPELWVSTTGTDSDFVVKLIDVYPDDFPALDPNPANIRMGGYQQLVRGEPFRAKFRNSLETPEPMVPGELTRIAFEMPDIAHVFRKGHKIMVHIQSSWFPLVDRNPQTFVDIPHAQPEEFQIATQRVSRSKGASSSIELSVIDAADSGR